MRATLILESGILGDCCSYSTTSLIVVCANNYQSLIVFGEAGTGEDWGGTLCFKIVCGGVLCLC